MSYFDEYAPQDWSTIISEVMRQAGLSRVEITEESLTLAKADPEQHVIEILLFKGRLVVKRVPLAEAQATISAAAATPNALQPEIYGELPDPTKTKH